jgi:hypothetical protein
MARKLLLDTLPEDALTVLQRVVEGEDKLKFFLSNIWDHLTCYIRGRAHYVTEEKAIFEFDEDLRNLLQGLGSRVDLSQYSPIPLTDDLYHMNLVGACRESGVEILHGYVDGASIDQFGRAKKVERHVLRLIYNGVTLDIAEEESSFHVLFFDGRKELSAIGKLRILSRFIKLLLRSVETVSGTAATTNRGIAKMIKADWRFVLQDSVYDFQLSRLERFFLSAGAVSVKIIKGEKRPLVVFFNERKAEELVQEMRQTYPDSPSPYHYTTKHGIYSKGFLSRLRHGL